jgi:hypothetical protein
MYFSFVGLDVWNEAKRKAPLLGPDISPKFIPISALFKLTDLAFLHLKIRHQELLRAYPSIVHLVQKTFILISLHDNVPL